MSGKAHACYFTNSNSSNQSNLKPTEKRIIEGCRKLKPPFQKELVLRYSGMLMTVSRRYTSDTESAKDILQEALIKILKSIPEYEERGSFEAWMKRIVINTALKYFNKSCFKNEVYKLDDMNETAVVPDIYAKLDAEELIKLINQLPEGFREVFNLNVIEGYSHKEIGEMLGIRESTSRSQLARARAILKKSLLKQDQIRIRI